MSIFKIIIVIFLFAVMFTSCKKDNPQVVATPIPNEFLTTTIINLQNVNVPGDKPTIRYYLNPNNVGSLPVVTPDTLVLQPNSKYTCVVVILDQTQTPVDTVSNEIIQRENYHDFFYFTWPGQSLADSLKMSNGHYLTLQNILPGGLMLVDSVTDHDSNIPPMRFGLHSLITTGSRSKGILNVILRHQPNVKNGTYPPGSTDLSVYYPTRIQ